MSDVKMTSALSCILFFEDKRGFDRPYSINSIPKKRYIYIMFRTYIIFLQPFLRYSKGHDNLTKSYLYALFKIRETYNHFNQDKIHSDHWTAFLKSMALVSDIFSISAF